MRLIAYLLRRIVTHSLGALGVLLAVYLLVELGDHGPRLAPRIGWPNVLAGSMAGIPAVAVMMLPVATLVGGVIALMRLDRRGELSALSLVANPNHLLLGAVLSWGLVSTSAALLLDRALVGGGERIKDELWGSRQLRLAGERDEIQWYRLPGGFIAHTSPQRLEAIYLDQTFRPRARFAWRLGKGAPELLSSLSLDDDVPLTALATRFLVEAWPTLRTLRGTGAAAADDAPSALATLRAAGHRALGRELYFHTRRALPWLCLVAAMALWRIERRCRGTGRDLPWLWRALAWVGLFWLVLSLGWQGARAGLFGPVFGGYLVVAGGLLAVILPRPRLPRGHASS